MIFQKHRRQPLFFVQGREKVTNYSEKTVHKIRGAGFASQKVYCFSFYTLSGKQMVSQPACL